MASDGGLGHALTAAADATADTGLPADDTLALLQTWRERGDDRFDPVGFYFIEALARRAATHDGTARARLDDRLAQLLDTYAARIAAAAATDAIAPAAGRDDAATPADCPAPAATPAAASNIVTIPPGQVSAMRTNTRA